MVIVMRSSVVALPCPLSPVSGAQASAHDIICAIRTLHSLVDREQTVTGWFHIILLTLVKADQCHKDQMASYTALTVGNDTA